MSKQSKAPASKTAAAKPAVAKSRVQKAQGKDSRTATQSKQKRVPASNKAKTQGKTYEEQQLLPLVGKQQAFVDEYLIDLNATQAAIRAGYAESNARSQGCENLTKPNIQYAIEQGRIAQQSRTLITADRVLLEVARLAMYDPRKFFSDTGTPLGIHELDDDTAASLAGLDVAVMPEGAGHVVKYKLVDKGPNLERLMKHLGLYERDNEQKIDPLTALLHGIANKNANAFMPVAQDPERIDTEKQDSGFNPVTQDVDHDED